MSLSINNKVNNSKGFSMVLALFAMLIISLLVAVAIPYTIQSTNLNVKNRDAIEAHYAAEAGVKRALVLMNKADKNIDWSWANGNTQNSFTGDAKNKYYITSISPSITAGSSPIPGTTYTITSTGYINNFEKKLSVKVDAPGIMSYGVMAGTLSLAKKSILATIIDATKAVSKLLSEVLSDILIGEIFPGGKDGTNAGYSYLGNQGIHYPNYDYEAFKHDATPLPQLVKDNSILTNVEYYHLTERRYYHEGDLIINGTDVKIDGGPAVLFVNGNINIGVNDYRFQTLGKSPREPVCIITTGNMTFNDYITDGYPLENVVLYAQGNMTFVRSITTENSILITPNTLAFDTSEHDGTPLTRANKINIATPRDIAANLAAAFNQIMTPYEIIKPYNWER